MRCCDDLAGLWFVVIRGLAFQGSEQCQRNLSSPHYTYSDGPDRRLGRIGEADGEALEQRASRRCSGHVHHRPGAFLVSRMPPTGNRPPSSVPFHSAVQEAVER
jgi:hypothetical protein